MEITTTIILTAHKIRNNKLRQNQSETNRDQRARSWVSVGEEHDNAPSWEDCAETGFRVKVQRTAAPSSISIANVISILLILSLLQKTKEVNNHHKLLWKLKAN
jgi:hypothetical protein